VGYNYTPDYYRNSTQLEDDSHMQFKIGLLSSRNFGTLVKNNLKNFAAPILLIRFLSHRAVRAGKNKHGVQGRSIRKSNGQHSGIIRMCFLAALLIILRAAVLIGWWMALIVRDFLEA
jgi:hypothetical protein